MVVDIRIKSQPPRRAINATGIAESGMEAQISGINDRSAVIEVDFKLSPERVPVVKRTAVIKGAIWRTFPLTKTNTITFFTVKCAFIVERSAFALRPKIQVR